MFICLLVISSTDQNSLGDILACPVDMSGVLVWERAWWGSHGGFWWTVLFVTHFLSPISPSVMSEHEKCRGKQRPEPVTGPANQPCTSPGLMNIVHLPESFHCKGGYLIAVVQEIDLALSLFFYAYIYFFLPKNIFCWDCPISTFHNFDYWLQERFPCLPNIPYSPESAGRESPGLVFNGDLLSPDLCKHLCILSVLTFALPKAALIHVKGLTGFSPHPFQYVKRAWIFQEEQESDSFSEKFQMWLSIW